MSTPQPRPPLAQRRLVRRDGDRMIAGVCAGVADYTGLDVTMVRILTVLLAVFGFGSVILAYLVAWVLVPLERTNTWAAATQ